MIKQMLIAIVLTFLLVGNSWDAEARKRELRQKRFVDLHTSESGKVREKRFINPFTSIINIWNALTHMYQILSEVG